MSRIPHPVALKGSQRWLQLAVNHCPTVIDRAIRSAGIGLSNSIEWMSPLESDDFAEYQDSAFTNRLGISLDRRALSAFWPTGGPVWDGLARSGDRLLLIEAKAHVREINSSSTKAGPKSQVQIKDALKESKAFLKVTSDTDWARCFYQYANRLAHLYLLRELNGLDAYLVFIYFTVDGTMGMPVSQEGWAAAIALTKTHLGLPKSDWLSTYVKDVYINTDAMRHVEWPPRLNSGGPIIDAE